MIKTIFSPEDAYGYWGLAIVSESITQDDLRDSIKKPIRGTIIFHGEIAGRSAVQIEKDEKSPTFIVLVPNDKEIPLNICKKGTKRYDYSFFVELPNDDDLEDYNSRYREEIEKRNNSVYSIFTFGANAVISNCIGNDVTKKLAVAYKYENGVLVDDNVYSIFVSSGYTDEDPVNPTAQKNNTKKKTKSEVATSNK